MDLAQLALHRSHSFVPVIFLAHIREALLQLLGLAQGKQKIFPYPEVSSCSFTACIGCSAGQLAGMLQRRLGLGYRHSGITDKVLYI